MLKLFGKYKGMQPKKSGKGYLIGVDGDGFRTNIVHVKDEDIGDFKEVKKGQDVEIPVFAFSFRDSDNVQYSYSKGF
ncbi:hypothetical protein QBE52_18980 [Clostridiaceae bacterium 35-E11]